MVTPGCHGILLVPNLLFLTILSCGYCIYILDLYLIRLQIAISFSFHIITFTTTCPCCKYTIIHIYEVKTR